MRLGYIYAGKVRGNLAPGGTDPYTNKPSAHTLLADLGMGEEITERVCPLLVQTDDYLNWDDPSTIAGDLYGLWVLVQVGNTPGDSTVLRLEPNTKGITMNSAIDIPVGGIPQGDLSYLLRLNPATGISAWTTGWLKIRVGEADRYIALSSTPP